MTVSADQPSEQRGVLNAGTAMRFVVLLGIVSLFADTTYEGARSITGPYLGVLGASATVVAVVAGFGELIGYAIRFASGSVSDRTREYWPVTLLGYVFNLFAVPLLAVTGRWETAAALMIAERIGKGIRTPVRDAMLSHASSEMGRGWGFGLHEAMDQTGAMIGPLAVALVLAVHGGYHAAFAFLLIPACLAVITLLLARQLYPRPSEFEVGSPALRGAGLPRVYWLYLAGAALVGAGYADFPLIAFRFQQETVIRAALVPVYFSMAMATAGLTSLILGRLFDTIGLTTVVGATLVSAFFAPLAFLGGPVLAFIGVAIWGLGMGAQESIMGAAIAGMTSAERRASAYGIFHTGYGIFWFLGSVVMGLLYGRSITALVIFSIVLQLLALPFFAVVARRQHAGFDLQQGA